jgi:hypothetical protein
MLVYVADYQEENRIREKLDFSVNELDLPKDTMPDANDNERLLEGISISIC